MGLGKYLLRKVLWYTGALLAALVLNFLLPRLVPGSPVDAIIAQMTQGGGVQGEQLQAIHEKEYASCIAGAQKEFDDGRSSERLARAGGPSQRESGLCLL